MRFITEFEITGDELKYPNHFRVSQRKRWSEDSIGRIVSESFGFNETGFIGNNGIPGIKRSLEIEAFPMDKWVDFKQKLNDYLHVTGWVSGAIIFKMIEELESFGKPSGDAITNLPDLEYRGPSGHCKACEDEKNGVKHIMAQKHTCRK